MSNDENVFRKGEWRDGQFYPFKSQADMGSTEAEKIARQWAASGYKPSDDDGEHGMPRLPPRGAGLSDADLELLTLAARATGATVEVIEGEQWVNLHFADGPVTHGWNPLRHSDDTFNLAVNLNMNIEITDGGWVYACGDYGNCSEPSGNDKAAAARRAVTRAAAEIGKQRS